jgi:hypothetical protein
MRARSPTLPVNIQRTAGGSSARSAAVVVARRGKNASARSGCNCSLHSLRLALVSRCLPDSLADEERVCPLARPGQRHASLAPCGGARFPTLAAMCQGCGIQRRAGRLRLRLSWSICGFRPLATSSSISRIAHPPTTCPRALATSPPCRPRLPSWISWLQ